MQITKIKNMKVQVHTVWHEFGHLFSYKLVEKLGGKKRKVIELCLELIDDKNPYIKTDCRDFIKMENEQWDKFQERLKISLENKGFFFQSIIQLMGAVFQVEYMIPDPSKDDFDKIFTNLDGPLLDGDITGHAGADFENVRAYLLDYDGNLRQDDMKKFALDIYSILECQNIFTQLRENVADFNLNYNGRSLQGNDLLGDELMAIGKIIEQSNLINLFNSKIIKLEEKNNS